jgi:hypothetical protein
MIRAFLLFTIFFTFSASILSAQSKFPGVQSIGKSYDVFGGYANAKSVNHYKLFDFSKIETYEDAHGNTLPIIVTIDDISEHTVKTVEGNSISEYVSNLTVDAGVKGKAFLFKGAFDHHFSKDKTSTKKMFYYTYMDVNTKWRVSLDTRNLAKLREYLDEQFKTDLANLTPEVLFDTYGSHFITKAFLGGRVDYSTVTVSTDDMTSTNVRNAVSAKFMGISGSLEHETSDASYLTTSNTSTKFYVIGGDSEFSNGPHNPEEYKAWAKSMTAKPVLCGFGKKSLMPIWDLIENPDRAVQLRDYFNAYILPKHPLPQFFEEDAVLDSREFVEDFIVNIIRFDIHGDCDFYGLTDDEPGNFQYEVIVSGNGERQGRIATRTGYESQVHSGNQLKLDKNISVSVPYIEGSYVKIWANLTETDDMRNQVLGPVTGTHSYPFSFSNLNNKQQDGFGGYTSIKMYHSEGCSASILYTVRQTENETASDFGTKAWQEFKLGNFDDFLNYSREALKLDNTMWWVQYNVCFVYLIQGNPLAFEKYKTISSACQNSGTNQAALNDITDYEATNGAIAGSEPVKVWLRSKL